LSVILRTEDPELRKRQKRGTRNGNNASNKTADAETTIT
jgi:hypothetical protein